MVWIKRNLYFVLALVAGVLVLGGGVFYSLTKKAAMDEVASQLEQASSKLDGLIKRKPFPNEENIKAAKVEQARVAEFKTNVLRLYQLPPIPDKIDFAQFKALLETEITALERRAERNGVKLPAKYGFSFGDVRNKIDLEEKDVKKIPLLATQVIDVRDICSALFDAKIHELIHVKRSPSLSSDAGNEMLGRKTTKNDTVGTMTYTYEATFQAFSAELGAGLANLANSPAVIVVKWINLEHGSGSANTGEPPPGENTTAMPGGMDPSLMARYGLRGGMMNPMMRYGMMPPQQAAPTTTPTKKGPALDEKPIRVTLAIDVIRKTHPGAAAGLAGGGGSGGGAGRAKGDGSSPQPPGAPEGAPAAPAAEEK